MNDKKQTRRELIRHVSHPPDSKHMDFWFVGGRDDGSWDWSAKSGTILGAMTPAMYQLYLNRGYAGMIVQLVFNDPSSSWDFDSIIGWDVSAISPIQPSFDIAVSPTRYGRETLEEFFAQVTGCKGKWRIWHCGQVHTVMSTGDSLLHYGSDRLPGPAMAALIVSDLREEY